MDGAWKARPPAKDRRERVTSSPAPRCVRLGSRLAAGLHCHALHCMVASPHKEHGMGHARLCLVTRTGDRAPACVGVGLPGPSSGVSNAVRIIACDDAWQAARAECEQTATHFTGTRDVGCIVVVTRAFARSTWFVRAHDLTFGSSPSAQTVASTFQSCSAFTAQWQAVL